MPRHDASIPVDDADILEIESLDTECVEPTLPRVHVMKVRCADEAEELDTQTLLDLGVAYREMGLPGSAIQQFRRVLAAGERQVNCHLMIALCLLDQDRLVEAISELKRGLFLEQITEREALALQYELGLAHERVGEVKEALFYYRRVRRLRPGFRNATARLSRLTFKRRAAPRSRPAAEQGEPEAERSWSDRLSGVFGRLALQPSS